MAVVGVKVYAGEVVRVGTELCLCTLVGVGLGIRVILASSHLL